VRKAGKRLCASRCKLVRATDGAQLWAETYDRDLDDIFQVQDEDRCLVVDQLKIKLLKAPTVTPVDPRVYALVLQAQALLDQQSKEGRAHGAAGVQAGAVHRAERSAVRGRAWDACTSTSPSTARCRQRRRRSWRARRWTRRCASIQRNVIAITGLARLAADFDFDAQAAADYNRRALRIEPNTCRHQHRGHPAQQRGCFRRSTSAVRLRVAHDPANPYRLQQSWHHPLLRAAMGCRDRRLPHRAAPESRFVGARNGIAASLLVGKADAAGAHAGDRGEPDEASRLQIRALAFYALGRTRESNCGLQALIRPMGNSNRRWSRWRTAIASIAMMPSIGWTKRRASAYPAATSVAFDVLTDPLRDDPRWLPFLRKIVTPRSSWRPSRSRCRSRGVNAPSLRGDADQVSHTRIGESLDAISPLYLIGSHSSLPWRRPSLFRRGNGDRYADQSYGMLIGLASSRQRPWPRPNSCAPQRATRLAQGHRGRTEIGLGRHRKRRLHCKCNGRRPYQCITAATIAPAASNKQDVLANISVGGYLQVRQERKDQRRVTIPAPPATLVCPGNQVVGVVSAVFTNITLTDNDQQDHVADRAVGADVQRASECP
jgi:hypothetical protein